MKSFQKKIAALTFAAIAMSVSFTAEAKGPRGDAPVEMNLTTEQQAAVKKIMDAGRAAVAETKTALESKKIELENQLKSDNPDKTQIETLSREIGELRGKLMVNRINTREELRKAGLHGDILKRDKKHNKKPRDFNLNEEQRATAKKIIDESRAVSQPLREAIAAKKVELDTLMKSETPDAVKIESVAKEIGGLRGQLLATRAATSAKLRAAGLPADLGKSFYDGNKTLDGSKLKKHGPKADKQDR